MALLCLSLGLATCLVRKLAILIVVCRNVVHRNVVLLDVVMDEYVLDGNCWSRTCVVE